MDEKYRETVARRLRFYLMALQMSQRDLAERVGVTEASVSNWTTGTKIPRADTIDKICDVFGCNRSDLIEEPAEPASPLVLKHIANFSELPPEQQALVDDLTKALQERSQGAGDDLAILQKLLSALQS